VSESNRQQSERPCHESLKNFVTLLVLDILLLPPYHVLITFPSLGILSCHAFIRTT